MKTRHNDRTNTVAFLRDVKGAVPTESEQSIKQHLDVFNQVAKYVQQKKDLMKQYKEIKMNTSRMTEFDGSQLNSDLGLNSDLDMGGMRKPRH